jgi:hypothetical protein
MNPGNVTGLDLAEHEVCHAHENALEGCLRFGRIAFRIDRPQCRPHNTLDPAPDHFRAGEPQAFLAAEMIGDGGDIGVRRRRDLPRRRGFEPLCPEQLDARPSAAQCASGRQPSRHLVRVRYFGSWRFPERYLAEP